MPHRHVLAAFSEDEKKIWVMQYRSDDLVDILLPNFGRHPAHRLPLDNGIRRPAPADHTRQDDDTTFGVLESNALLSGILVAHVSPHLTPKYGRYRREYGAAKTKLHWTDTMKFTLGNFVYKTAGLRSAARRSKSAKWAKPTRRFESSSIRRSASQLISTLHDQAAIVDKHTPYMFPPMSNACEAKHLNALLTIPAMVFD